MMNQSILVCKRRMIDLIPNPGVHPTKAAPRKGQEIFLRVYGLPPYKDLHASILNPVHRHYARFVALHHAATKAMNGRAWSCGAITLSFTAHVSNFDKNKKLNDYLGGIMDTFDGSHGEHFTYLPICFQDDCQVISARCEVIDSHEPYYEVNIRFDSNE